MHPRSPRPRRLTAVLLAVTIGVVGLVAGGASAEETPDGPAVFVTWTTGLDYSSGDYGLPTDSRLVYVPLGATVDIDYWRFVVTVPLLHSDGVVGFTGGPAPVATVRDEKTGLGEAITSISRLFAPLADGLPWVEVTGQISWPTRTAEILGTGDFAFAAQLDVFKPLGDFTPFVRVGRNFFLAGSLDDRFYTSVGATYAWTESVSTGLAYDWLGRAVGGVRDGHELVPYASFALDERWRLGPYGVIGLTSGSPDYGVGFSVSFAP